MSDFYETSSNGTKSFDWKSLPEGKYRVIDGELFRVDKEPDLDAAADAFVSALRKLA